MKRLLFSIMMCLLTVICATAVDMNARAERKAIEQGNALYKEKNYHGALAQYDKALKVNPSGLVAQFNKALALTRIADGLEAGQAEQKSKMLAEASKIFESVAKHTSDNPGLAARANYNHGNIAFNQEKYPDAIEDYKNALRLNPDDNKARRNLRIAQQRLPKQDKNQNKNQNKDKNQDQDQNKDKNKSQSPNQDQDKSQNKDKNQDKQQSSPKQDMSKQAADRILKRSNDKETQTRKKMMGGSPAGRSKGW